ncbi:MAG: response regulator transcription factor [Angelakisella sp.]
MNYKILIIEDEKNIADIIAHNLKREDFEPVCAYDGESGLEAAKCEDCDLVLLDVMLPKMDGWEVLRELRKISITPVIMLTAREEEEDKIMGLDLGADDYMTKPFSMKELISRIKANLRRASFTDRQTESGALSVGGIRLDSGKMEATKSGTKIALSNKEFELLSFFMNHLNTIFSREELLDEVWHYDGFYGDLRAVDVMVRRLREKIEDDAAVPQYIQTKRGQGYMFEGK